MEMKWNPIIDGDLSGIPTDKMFLFTICDEEDGEHYVVDGWIEKEYVDYGDLEVVEVTNAGQIRYRAEYVKAWMDYPPPYMPFKCTNCEHWYVWCDEFGDRWSECRLLKNVPFTEIKFGKCPLDR